MKTRGMGFVGCDQRSAGAPDFDCIVACRLSIGQARGRTAVIDARAHIGVPALAFARLSHPTLFAPFRFIPTGHRVDTAPVEIVLALVDKTME